MWIAILLLLVINILAFCSVPWFVHVLMVRNEVNEYGWASFETFKRYFDSYNWTADSLYKHSLWDRRNDCEIHAGIISFEGKGMILKSPISYYLAMSHVRNHINNKLEKREAKVKWE